MNYNITKKPILIDSIYYFLGTMFLLIDAFYNAYPIIYHDLSTYVANGFDLETPIDRPITYCLFVRLFSLNGYSLWPVVFAQAYILSFLLFKLMRSIFGRDIKPIIILGAIMLLSLFTGISWTVSQIMPDIFTPMEIIIISILVIGEQNKKQKVLLYFLFFLATSMHLSHISFNITLLFFLFVIKRLNILRCSYYLDYKMLLLLFGITFLGFTTMLSASAKSKHVFFMGAMVEHGILKEFLEDNCPNASYAICKYKDDLPSRAYQFVWDENSPLYKIGGWKSSEKEFNRIILKTLTRPKYIGLHIKASILATIDQLVTFDINDSNGVFLEGTLPYDRMVRYLPGDLEMYLNSKQMNNQFGFTDNLNTVFSIIVAASLLIIIYLLIKGNVYREKLLMVLILVILGVLLNAWVSGTFANSINRLGCKMTWLIPMISLIGLIQLYINKKLIRLS